MVGFGTRIKNIIELKHMTQKELAELSNTTAATISRYINEDRIPSADILVKIATALDVSVDYILGRTDNPSRENDYQTQDLAGTVSGYPGKGKTKTVNSPVRVKEANPGDQVIILNPDIGRIARAARKLTSEQAEQLRKYAEFMFPEAFDDNGNE